MTTISKMAAGGPAPTWRRPRALAALVAVLVAGACGDADEAADGTGGGGAPAYGGTAVVLGPTDLGPMNPLVATEAYTQELNRYALFLPLVRLDEDLEYQPALAESWELHGDTAATFRLRRDVRWHDGVPTTAEDVAFTFRAVKNPATASPAAAAVGAWTEVQVVDSFTVRFRFEPHMEPLAGVPAMPIAPRHALDSIPPERLRQAAFNRAPVGNGPFRYVSHQANDRWVFGANPDFPEALGGRPYLDRLVWRVVAEQTAQVTEIIAGQADVILVPPAEQYRQLAGQDGLQGVIRPTWRYSFIGWNGRVEPLDDPAVRRALSLAIDRRAALDALRSGFGELAAGPIPPAHWAFDDAVEPLPFDTAAAAALLAGAGFTDRDGDGVRENGAGEELDLELQIPSGATFSRDVAQLIQSDLADVGVRMSIRPVDGATLIQNISVAPRDFEGVLMGWQADFRVDLRGLFHSAEADAGPFQLAGYRNAELDRLLEQAEVTTDRDASARIWSRVQEILRDEQPWTFLYYYPELVIARDRVGGLEMDARGAFVNVPRWWVAGATATAGDDAAPGPAAAEPASAGAEAGRE